MHRLAEWKLYVRSALCAAWRYCSRFSMNSTAVISWRWWSMNGKMRVFTSVSPVNLLSCRYLAIRSQLDLILLHGVELDFIFRSAVGHWCERRGEVDALWNSLKHTVQRAALKAQHGAPRQNHPCILVCDDEVLSVLRYSVFFFTIFSDTLPWKKHCLWAHFAVRNCSCGPTVESNYPLIQT